MRRRSTPLARPGRAADRARQRVLGWGNDRLARGFAIRLLLAIVVTFLAVGTVGYFVMSKEMQRSEIARYATMHDADASALEAIGRSQESASDRLHEMNTILTSVARRPGTLETLLIDERNVIRASGRRAELVGTRDSDPRIDAALRSGKRYAGRKADARARREQPRVRRSPEPPERPLRLRGELRRRYPGHQPPTVRRTLGLIGVLALSSAAGVFYLSAAGRCCAATDRARARDPRRPHRPRQPPRLPGRARRARSRSPRATASHSRSLMFDVDDFKFLNDRHGHAHGDDVLRRVAEILARRPRARTARSASAATSSPCSSAAPTRTGRASHAAGCIAADATRRKSASARAQRARARRCASRPCCARRPTPRSTRPSAARTKPSATSTTSATTS